MRRKKNGQAALEFAIVYSAVILPVTFAIIFTAELLWVWNSVVEFTRNGARYAATHCWQPGSDNVRTYMQQNVPPTIDMNQFQSGEAEIQIQYYSKDPDTGALVEFACEGSECSTECVPDTVTVSVTNYEFRAFMSYLGLPPVTIPNFQTTVPIESLGCDPDQGVCLP